MKYFCIPRKNIPILQKNIKTIDSKVARKLNISEFNASNGWLGRFKKNHNIHSVPKKFGHPLYYYKGNFQI